MLLKRLSKLMKVAQRLQEGASIQHTPLYSRKGLKQITIIGMWLHVSECATRNSKELNIRIA